MIYDHTLWLANPESLHSVKIIPDSLVLSSVPRVSFGSDGDLAFFSANRDIYSISLKDYSITKITNATDNRYWCPVLSTDDSTLTFMSYNQLKESKDYYNTVNYITLGSGQPIVHELQGLGQYNSNALYNNLDNKLYYDGIFSFSKADLSGMNTEIINTNGAWYNAAFINSHDNNYIVRDIGSRFEIFNLDTHTEYSFPATTNYWTLASVGKLCKDENIFYYVDPDLRLCRVNLDTQLSSSFFAGSDDVIIDKYYNLAPTWNGAQVYFCCELTEH